MWLLANDLFKVVPKHRLQFFHRPIVAVIWQVCDHNSEVFCQQHIIIDFLILYVFKAAKDLESNKEGDYNRNVKRDNQNAQCRARKRVFCVRNLNHIVLTSCLDYYSIYLSLLLSSRHLVETFLTKISVIKFERAVDLPKTLFLKVINDKVSIVLTHAFKIALWIGVHRTKFGLSRTNIGLVGCNAELNNSLNLSKRTQKIEICGRWRGTRRQKWADQRLRCEIY